MLDHGTTDEKLMELFRGGSNEAFNELRRRYQTMMERFLWNRHKNLSDVEDVIQQTFMSIFRSAERFDAGRSFKSWAMRILINKSITYYEANKRSQITTIDDDIYVHDRQMSPEAEAEANEILLILEQYIDSLNPDTKMVFLLRVVDSLDYKEIAEKTGKSEDTLRRSFFDARKRLQSKIKSIYPYLGQQNES